MWTYHVAYEIPGDDQPMIFRCEADDALHANEQLMDAEPNAKIVLTTEHGRSDR